MMRKQYYKISLFLLLAITTLTAQTNIKWQETFDGTSIPDGWRVVDADASVSGLELEQTITTPGGTDIAPQIGQSFWTSNAQNANRAGEIDEWLISPQISVIYSGDSLYFWAGAVDEGFDDSIRVKVSTTNSEMTSFTHELAHFKVDGPAGTWHRYGFDLSEFDSLDIYFAINYYIKDGGPGGQHSDFVWIDHPVVTGDPGSINNPPSMVNLREPANEGYVDFNSTAFDFTWTASQDLDGEDLEHTLSILNVFPQMHFTVMSDTFFTMTWKDVLNENFRYHWTVEVTDGKSTVASTDTFSFEIADPAAIANGSGTIPGDPVLHQNYPNPFNPVTTINYQLPITDYVELSIYNLQGQKIESLVSEQQAAGNHAYQFDGRNLASGVYYYHLMAGSFSDVKKMILIK
jgi:hypothetical protein